MTWQQHISDLGELNAHEALSKHTTLAIGGAAAWYFKPNNKAALCQALPLLPTDLPILPLGRGSNMLISDTGFDGVVIDLGACNNLQIEQQQLNAEAGVRMSKVAQAAANSALTGLEFMATVPGDLGGGIAMNAGAFKQQVSDTLQEITIVLRDGTEQTLKREQLNMHYRFTDLPEQAIVISARFSLSPSHSDEVRQRMREMRQQRSSSQPLALPNCGSVFKNPQGDHAARLIEAAGLKGQRMGDAQISDIHANFIVNHGDATAQDVIQLITLAQSTVQEKFHITLEPEVRIFNMPTLEQHT